MDDIVSIKQGNSTYKIFLPDREQDHIQKIISKTGKPYEIKMLQAIRGLLTPGDLVLDIGANIGNHSLYLAKICKCKIIAFEPNPYLCSIFRKSISLNNLKSKILLHEVGVGEKNTKAHFENINPKNLGAQCLSTKDSEPNNIKIITLDSLELESTVKIIKLDIEGMEIEALKGGFNLIRRDKPILFIEAHNLEAYKKLEEVMLTLGYIYIETFNATPTHLFRHVDTIKKDELIKLSHQLGRNSYDNSLLSTQQATDKNLPFDFSVLENLVG